MKSVVLRIKVSTKLLLATFLVLVLIAISACDNNKTENKNVNIIQNTGGDTLQNLYAQNFTVIKFNSYTILQVKKDSNVWFNYCLYTQKKPGLNTKNITYIKQPVTTITALSSTHLGMLEKLNLQTKLVAVSDIKYICSKQIEKLNITSVGDIGTGSFENYVKENPTVLMHAGFDMSAPVLNQLSKTNIASIANFDWKETHPLGRAEWIKVFGLLFNKEKEATSYFNQEVLRYEYLKNLVSNTLEKPTVLAGSVWGDFWNAPAGGSYLAKLLKDANVNYVYSNTKGTGSLNLNFEEVLAKHAKVSFWIDAPGEKLNAIKELNPKYANLEAFKQKNVFSYSKNQNCFWEKSAVNPHKILADFITIFHPNLTADTTLYFYNRAN